MGHFGTTYLLVWGLLRAIMAEILPSTMVYSKLFVSFKIKFTLVIELAYIFIMNTENSDYPEIFPGFLIYKYRIYSSIK